MKEKIKKNIDDPEIMEELYQSDKKGFTSAFKEIYPEIMESGLSRFWKIRLDYDKISFSSKKLILADIIKLIAVCLFTGFLIKIPVIFGVDEEMYYFRNTGIIVFGGLVLYVALNRRNFDYKKIAYVAGSVALLTIYVNVLPFVNESDSTNLVYLHLPFLMWAVYGLVYIDFDHKDLYKRIDYIRYNGDLAILMAVMVIAGGILSGITVILFETIGLDIEELYIEYVGLIGAVSIPIVATFITKNFKSLTNKIAPIIANIFSPLVLVAALIFLIALTTSGKNLFEDRDFLLIFNLMLLGVMVVIVFSVSETFSNPTSRFNAIVLFLLAILTVIIDGIALSAIFYRLGAYGITPNRLAVLGSNVLIIGNLGWLIVELYKVNFKKADISSIEITISKYLPVYLFWIIFVVFGFPLIFGIG
jgi:hypothetical protein